MSRKRPLVTSNRGASLTAPASLKAQAPLKAPAFLTTIAPLTASLVGLSAFLAIATGQPCLAVNSGSDILIASASEGMQEEENETPDKVFERLSGATNPNAPSAAAITRARAASAADANAAADANGNLAATANSSIEIFGSRRGLRQFDDLMVNLIQQYNVPGGALAIAKDGHLVLARGYGLAVKQGQIPFKPASIFCLASVTKAVQGVSCLKLVDDGKLRLDDKLYDVLGRPNLGNVVDKRVYDITVRQLLHHSAGWKTDFVGYDQQTYDTLTQSHPISFEELFLWVMANKPLDYAPGTECHYSNYQFGGVKCVIEHASGQGFESYINEHVMAPMGITDSHLEAPAPEYLPGEAHRFGPKGKQLPGGHKNEKLTGSMGSWECSAIDMVKFLTAVDGTRTKPFLSAKSFDAMVAPVPPPVPVRPNGSTFGLGWDTVLRDDGGVHFAKNGGVAGVHTLIEHLPNNVDLAIFFNGTGADLKPKLTGAATEGLHQAISNVRNWPDIDLFNEYK